MPQSPPARTPRYHSFLLHLWDEADAGWRCSLENPHTGERFGFRTLDDLPVFLRAWIRMPPEEKPMRD
jgi:hypothetical protein